MSIKIAILYPATVPWIAHFLDGIRHYAETHGVWHIFGSPPSMNSAGETALTLRSLKGWKGDGIIISSNDIDELHHAKRIGIPVLNMGGGLPLSHGIPRVMVDHYQAGCMAAEHMIERGLSNLVFFGWENVWYSQQRCAGFQDRAAESNIKCTVYLRPTDEDALLTWSERIAILTRWLSKLPLPCGIFAVHDYRAQLIMEACKESGLRVPNDVAVVGMDNDETICEHSVPKLTSITRNSYLLGVEAARILDRMIQDGTIPPEETLISPSEIVIRESSDMMYCSDPLVRQAIEYMRHHLKESFNIAMIADDLRVSKRKLEMRFSESTHSSPHQYLTKLRINHAQTLIKLDPKKSIETIAYACGFKTNTTFYAAFRRITGKNPSTFRSQSSNKNLW